MRLDNSEKFCLSIGIECPWIVVQGEEAVSIKFSIILFGWIPFLVEDRSLLAEIDIIVESIVIEVWIWKLVFFWLSIVCLIENIHDLNHLLHSFLLEDFLHDNDRDVELESLDHLTEFVLGHAMKNQISWEVNEFFWTLGSEVMMASLWKLHDALEYSIEGEDFHLWSQQQHWKAPNSYLKIF